MNSAISMWLRVAYALRLRGPFIRAQRWLAGENNAPKKPLPFLPTPEAVQAYMMSRFQYRPDEFRLFNSGITIPLDWVSDPEVFQYRLESETLKDGDCDDIHFWAANMLLRVPEVVRVYLLSSGFRTGAHTTVVFQRDSRSWWHLDYHLYQLDDPNDAPLKVAERYTDPSVPIEVVFYLFETVNPPWRAAAIGPDKLKVNVS